MSDLRRLEAFASEKDDILALGIRTQGRGFRARIESARKFMVRL